MTEPPSQDRRPTAIHEAGHAVVGRVLGMYCGSATIVANEKRDTAGHVIIADPWATYEAWEARGKYRNITSACRGLVLTCMAGAIAEEELLGHCTEGNHGDRRQIAMLFDEIMPRGTAEADTYEARLRAKCQGIVRRHRKTIARVAEALLAEGTLTAVEIDTMIETQAALSGGGVEP